MKYIQLSFLLLLATSALLTSSCSGTATANHADSTAKTSKLSEIFLSDPCVLADDATNTYYMTGTGGKIWKSNDLENWTGPIDAVEHDKSSWMGEKPEIWAAELHKYKGRYYYFATFTNNNIKIDTVAGNIIPRRASHILASDSPEGPYRPIGNNDYLPAGKPTLDGTFWVDTDGKPYMVYCHEWLQNLDGTIEKIQLSADLSAPVGESAILFRASDSPWSRDDSPNIDKPNKVTDGPWLFRTGTGRLGMIWTSWIKDIYTQGVAYSESGSLNGPWVQEANPITPPNVGHGMIFRTFDGRTMLSAHSHLRAADGRYIRNPRFFEINLSGNKLELTDSIGIPR